MLTQFNLSGLNPELSNDAKLTLSLDALPCDTAHRIYDFITALGRELGLTEGQCASVADDTLASLSTMLLAKLLASRKVF